MYTYFLESITGNPIQILIFAAMLLLRNQPAYPHTELGVPVISPVITNTFCQSLGTSLPVEPLFNEVPRDWPGEIGSPNQGVIISRFFAIHKTITRMKNIVRYIKDYIVLVIL